MTSSGQDRQDRHDRQEARQLGIRAERLAEILLRLKFFRVVARNYRVRDGEIDLIVRRGDLIAFVEVKARPGLYAGMESIAGRKQKRMSRAARHWVAANPWSATCTLRADGIFIVPRHLPRHVPDLFVLEIG